jgi:uncharacterized repeat protein (TIGR01451 family)
MKTRLSVAVCPSALLVLSIFLVPVQGAQGSCAVGEGGTLGVDNLGPVHIGDTISVTTVEVANLLTSFQATNFNTFVVFPNNTAVQVMHVKAIPPGTSCQPGGAPFDETCPGGSDCISFANTYVVSFADIGRSLTFSRTIGNFTAVCNSAGIAGNIQFEEAGAGAALTGTGGTGAPVGAASLCQTLFIPVIFPCISITKDCDNACTQYGQPILFHGTVSNTGDSPLINVVVTDTPPAGSTSSQITFENVQPSNRPWDGKLAAGESAIYHGSFTPPNNGGSSLCGPFTDTISATAVDAAGAPLDNTTACINPTTGVSTGTRPPVQAVCHVQAAAAITLTKDCNPKTLTVGQSYSETFTVCNVSPSPLTGVVIHDTRHGVITDIPVGDLSPGQCQTLNVGPFITTANDCPAVTDSAIATGDNLCPPDATCPASPTIRSAPATCTVTVSCLAQICVTKQIACFLGTNSSGDEVCATFSHSATGFKVVTPTVTNLPAFCYSITVSNCGQVALTNVTLIDDKFGNLTSDFPCVSGLFTPGSSCSFTFKTSLEFDQTNTVAASGQSVASGQFVSAQDFATGHVFQASIECTKLVSSPDDLDGNPNDNHVSFACGSGLHEVSYSVVVTNSGDADLTNIVITDPALAQVCTLPGPFALPAHQVLHIPLCANVPFDCGTGSTSNNCANPAVGQAGDCTVLELGPASVSITGPPGGILGDVCIAPRGKLAITGSQYVTGNINLGPGATFSKSGSGIIGGAVATNVDLTGEINAALAATSFAASQPCTQAFTQLNQTATITGAVGLNVICVQDVVLNSATITVTGPIGARFIFNVAGKFVLNGVSRIIVAGGVQPKDVLYNIIGTGADVAFTGGGGGVNCCNSSVDGTLLAVQRKINLSPGLVNGQVISGMNISIVSGSSVRCPPGCTPVSVPNTITITAEISASQSNTNLAPACVFDINGQHLTTSTQCSALVECSPISGKTVQGIEQSLQY